MKAKSLVWRQAKQCKLGVTIAWTRWWPGRTDLRNIRGKDLVYQIWGLGRTLRPTVFPTGGHGHSFVSSTVSEPLPFLLLRGGLESG